MTTTVSGTFTGTDVSPVGYALGDGNLSFLVTGPYMASVWFERSITPSQIAWERFITTPLAPGDSAAFPVFGGQVFRMRCTAYTSGTVTYTFTPPARVTPGTIGLIDWAAIPTSDVGLASGQAWLNGGVLCVVP